MFNIFKKKPKPPAERRKGERRQHKEDPIRLVRKGDRRLDSRRKEERRKSGNK
jgi:hypothetical protein